MAGPHVSPAFQGPSRQLPKLSYQPRTVFTRQLGRYRVQEQSTSTEYEDRVPSTSRASVADSQPFNPGNRKCPRVSPKINSKVNLTRRTLASANDIVASVIVLPHQLQGPEAHLEIGDKLVLLYRVVAMPIPHEPSCLS